ncbi:MAG: EAL domain-containing protein [Aquificaceae bacterium]
MGIPFKTIGNLFILDIDTEQFLGFTENFPKDVLQNIRLYIYDKDGPIKVEDLIEAGFNSISLDSLLEDYLFKNLSQVMGEGQVCFHAIISSKEKKIGGFEALCRLPIPICKLFKVSDRIALLLDSYCRERALLEFRRKFLSRPYFLFLNFHPKFLKSPLENAVEIVVSLANKGIAPSRLVVEINEYEGMDIKSLKLIRNFLRREGVKVALDDVGAGYAGLAQLTEMHPDIVKLDMALVRDVHKSLVKQSVVKGLVSACKSSGIEVLAEGVEKKEELEYLLSLGVDLIQGFLFAKPSPHPSIREIEKLAYNLLT